MEIFDFTKTFKDLELSSDIVDQLSKLNYKNPTQIQSQAIPYGLQKQDVIGLAETGSGKTLAFVLPIIENLLKDKQPFYGLILAPTRELCLQIQEHINAIGKQFDIISIVIVGGLDLMS